LVPQIVTFKILPLEIFQVVFDFFLDEALNKTKTKI